MTETLAEALPKEIHRCRRLLNAYRSIPTGAFAAAMIGKEIDAAIKAMAEQDLPRMVQALKALRECK